VDVVVMPTWFWPFLSFLGGLVGAWVAVKVNVVRLQTQMELVLKDVATNKIRIAQHNEDLLTHDMELEHVLDALKLKRARRQPLRDYDSG
jgi:hypothetical protein